MTSALFAVHSGPSSRLPESCLFPVIPHFTGRDKECDDIINHLTTQPTRLVSVWGSPGFGKTSVATTVGHMLDSKGSVVQFTCLRKVKTVNDMAQKILNVSKQNDQEPSKQRTSARDRVLQWLSSISRPLFLFFDNADDLLESKDEFLQFLREILTSSKDVKLLCTTQTSLEDANYDVPTASVRIRPLDNSSSRRLVQALLPSVPDDGIESIRKVSGDVPLAVRLVCSVMHQHGELSPNWKELLCELSSCRESTLETLDMPDYPDHLRLKVLFEHCFRSLRPDQQKAFVCLSVFNGSFNLAAAIAVLDKKGELAATKVMKEMEKKSLLEYDTVSSLYTIHPLLQSFGELIGSEEMEEIFQDAKVRFYGYCLAVLETLNTQFLAGQSSRAFHLFQMDEQNISESLLKGIASEEHYTTVVHVLSQAEIFLDSIFWNDDAPFEKFYDEAIRTAKQRQQGLDCSQLLVAKAFAYLTWVTTKSTGLLLEAENLHECHSVPVKVKGKLQCYQGIDLVIRGKTKDGVKLLQSADFILKESAIDPVTKVLTSQMLALCDDAPDASESLTKEMYGQTAEKEMPHVPAFSLFDSELTEDTIKKDKPFILQTVFLFNAVCENLVTPKGKEMMKKCALQIRGQLEESLGQDVHLSTLYMSVSGILRHLGQYKEAIQCYKKIVQSQEMAELPARDMYKIAKTHMRLGLTQYQLTDYHGALESHTKALALRQKLLGDHEHTANSYDALGCTQNQLTDYHGALESHTKALTLRQKLLGDHEDTANSYDELGFTQYQLTDYDGALDSHTKALALREKLLGDHEDTANSYDELGFTQYQLTDYDGALESHTKALALREKLLGDHEETANLL